MQYATDRHTPLVGAIMTVYNGEVFLCEAIDSLLNQSLDDLEVVVVDDGSTDSTASLLSLIHI